jgi:hypothetical protein
MWRQVQKSVNICSCERYIFLAVDVVCSDPDPVSDKWVKRHDAEVVVMPSKRLG